MFPPNFTHFQATYFLLILYRIAACCPDNNVTCGCLLRQMALHRLFQLSSVLRSAVSLTLRRNIGISAVLFNRAKELDPVQKLFLDKIRDYNTKSKSVDETPTLCHTYTHMKCHYFVQALMFNITPESR